MQLSEANDETMRVDYWNWRSSFGSYEIKLQMQSRRVTNPKITIMHSFACRIPKLGRPKFALLIVYVTCMSREIREET